MDTMKTVLIEAWRAIWTVLFSPIGIIWLAGIWLANPPIDTTERYLQRLLWCWSFGRETQKANNEKQTDRPQ